MSEKRFHGNTKIICDHSDTGMCPMRAEDPKKRVKKCYHSKPHRPKGVCQGENFLCRLPGTVSPIDGMDDVMVVSCVLLKDKSRVSEDINEMVEEMRIDQKKKDIKLLKELAEKYDFELVPKASK